MNPKDALILAQVAAKAAATVHAGTGDMTTYPQTVETIHADLLTAFESGSNDSCNRLDVTMIQAHLYGPEPAVPQTWEQTGL